MSILLLQADARQIPLQDKSIHCCITSPPYWGLRDYGTSVWAGTDPLCDHSRQTSHQEGAITTTSRPTNTNHEREPWKGGSCGRCGATSEDAQLGTESLHDCLAWARQEPPCGQCYVCGMRQVFAEVWRVLRDDGGCFLNLGDSYSSGGRGASVHHKDKMGQATAQALALGRKSPPRGLKPKDLCGIPWRVALALQADGWILRSEIIWHKPNPLPESVTDRVTRSHEQVFMFAKSPRYYFDAHAIAEAATIGNNGSSFVSTHDLMTKPGLGKGARKSDAVRVNGRTAEQITNAESIRRDLPGPFSNNPRLRPTQQRNARDVWTIATEPTPFAHYATFPTALVHRCILAGTSAAGCCPACAAPYVRQAGEQGWAPGCACDAGDPRPCVVFDPFTGSSTTLVVSRTLGRHAVGVDLSWTYLHKVSRQRLGLTDLAAWEGRNEHHHTDEPYGSLPLFAHGRPEEAP